jgi:hypothetical protein
MALTSGLRSGSWGRALLGRCHRAEFGYLNGSDMEPPQGVEPWTYAIRVEVKGST